MPVAEIFPVPLLLVLSYSSYSCPPMSRPHNQPSQNPTHLSLWVAPRLGGRCVPRPVENAPSFLFRSFFYYADWCLPLVLVPPPSACTVTVTLLLSQFTITPATTVTTRGRESRSRLAFALCLRALESSVVNRNALGILESRDNCVSLCCGAAADADAVSERSSPSLAYRIHHNKLTTQCLGQRVVCTALRSQNKSDQSAARQLPHTPRLRPRPP